MHFIWNADFKGKQEFWFLQYVNAFQPRIQ